MNKKNKRSFVLGDEWIYYKIYTGAKTSDKVLEEAIKPATEYLLKTQKIDQWFFIRYSDPDLHLRVRLHYTKSDNILAIIQTIYKHIRKFINNELIWKIQTDTYERELERYGLRTMELSEILFFHESNLFVKVLPAFKNPEGETQRWIFALKLIDCLLDTFGYILEDKAELLFKLKDRFGKEFGMERFLKNQLDKKYRNERSTIEKNLNNEPEGDIIITAILSKLESHNDSILLIAKKILKLNKKNSLEIPLDDLLSSYIHMSINRIFRTQQRIHEMVLYDFLHRYYKSEIAKRNNY